MRVERSGAERMFQRIGQEYGSRIHAVDVVNTSDAAHFIVWKRNGWLAPYRAGGRRQASIRRSTTIRTGCSRPTRVWLSSLGYNTNLVKAEDAPKSFADLLDPKWAGKMVKAHPAYSGTIMTATFQIARELGWGYFEKLAKQQIMQVQSSTDPPKKLALGERAVMADGNEYNLIQLKEAGQPVEMVYPAEGTPLDHRPERGVQERAQSERRAAVPELAASRAKASSCSSTSPRQHSVHPQVKEKPGRKPLTEIKLMKDDPAAVEAQSRGDQGALRARSSRCVRPGVDHLDHRIRRMPTRRQHARPRSICPGRS